MILENQDKEVEEIEEVVETTDDQGNDTTDWKAIALKTQGMAKRFKTKIDKLVAKPVVEADPPAKKETLDKLDRLLLRTEKIIEPEEIKLVEEYKISTGRDIDSILTNKHFLAELKDIRDFRNSKEAIPSGSGRSGNSARDSVEYWMAKGELPPKDQFELRRQVVNGRIKREKNKSIFTDTPIV